MLNNIRYMATLDKHTSSTCRHLDKKSLMCLTVKLGVTAPPFHPLLSVYDDSLCKNK